MFGVVEDINDPLQLGRVRLRVHGVHTFDRTIIETESLPWALCPLNNSGGTIGGGSSPSGYALDSLVWCVPLDADQQTFVVFGSIPTQTSEESIERLSESEDYDLEESGVNRLARGVETDLVTDKKENRFKSDEFEEPETAYAPVYPYNNVYEGKSGNIVEIDDTEGAERIHVYHKSGTFIEIHPDGTIVQNTKSNKYTIVANDDNVRIEGNANVQIKGNCNVTIEGNCTQVIKGDCTQTIDGDKTEHVKGDLNVSADGEIIMQATTIKLN